MIKLNGHEIKPTIFPDGTSQVIGLDELVMFDNEIYFDFESENEIMQLYQILDYCDYCVSHRGFNGNSNLYMPFLPYSRQDKNLEENYFAKGTFTRMLKRFTFLGEIKTLDVHSNIKNIEPIKEISKTLIKVDPDMICYPDKGAKDRYSKLSILEDFISCSFSKDRDQSTGYIKNLFLNELVDIEKKTVLIIDDICDGGMTFKLSAEKLLQCGAKEVILYTTHGIYSKGVQTLLDSGISRVFNYKGEVFPSKQTKFLLKEF